MAKGTYDIIVRAPKEFCKFCNARLVQNKYTGQYFIKRNGACSWCHDTGDHDYHSNGHLTLTEYTVDKIKIV